jgi:hypothetical protein
MFPGEERKCEEIRQKAADHLDLARRLLSFWLGTDKDRGISRCKLPDVVVNVAAALNVKATRQYRTIIELCERGEASAAAAITRALFETDLATAWVLKRRVLLKASNKMGPRGIGSRLGCTPM